MVKKKEYGLLLMIKDRKQKRLRTKKERKMASIPYGTKMD